MHHLTSRLLFNLAHALGVISAGLTYAGTHNVWLALAVAFLSLTLHVLATAAVWQFAELQQESEEPLLDHRKIVLPEPRHECRTYAYGATSPHDPRLWNHRPTGFTLWQTLAACGMLTCVLCFIPALYAICVAVMGMQEPKW